MDMCSNGTLIDRELALDLKKYLSEISISFDTDSASLYKELRGVDLLSKVYAGIDNLVCANVEVHLTCVVNRRNINDLESIINTASKLGVKSLSFLRVITSISADAERAQGLALGMHECEEVLRTINKCRDKYNISINTKRLNNNICHELCGAGKSILGITTEGQLLNCIMNRNSNTIDALHNKVTQLDIERNFLKMDTCVV